MAKYKIIPSSRTIVQSPISIGHKAEKGVEAIEFDVTAWVETYGSGTLTVIMRRWGDAIPYPIALEIDENNKATWTLSDIDTAKAGMAYAQLSYIVGETVVKKSDIYTFRVMDSLTGEGEPPEAYESWLEHLTHLAAEAMAEVLDIEGIVTDKTLTVDGGIADGKATGDALALKADKSTTYTKSEVDQMIESVDVETDTTLSVTGKPADAKKTGDEITALKADLDVQENEFSSKVASRFGAEYSPNLIESDESMTAGYISKDGAFHSSSSMKYTDFIPVKPGWMLKAYALSNGVFLTKAPRFIACYDESKAVVSSAGSNSAVSSFTVPNGISYVKVTFDGTGNLTGFMVSANVVPTEYIAYTPATAKIEENFLTYESNEFLVGVMANGISSKNVTNKYGCALPQTKIFQTLGLPEKWYNDSMITPPMTNIIVSAGSQYASKSNDGISFLNTAAVTSSNGYSWWWYDVFYALIKYSTGQSGTGWPRRYIAENLSNCTLLAIGDSTVDHDTMTATILSHFTEKGATVTLLGTLGDGSETNKNEGRAGWKATDYLTNRQYNNVVNPFYNPTTETFDFAYYMQNQNYTGVDFVVLQLGINDLYNSDDTAIEPTWAAMETIIDSILAYNTNIKIILNLPTTPNSDQSAHSVSEFMYRNRIIRYNEYAMAQSLAKYGTSKVRCSYCHMILDPDTEIRDNVHPTVAGYQKMALEVVNQINCWQAGV